MPLSVLPHRPCLANVPACDRLPLLEHRLQVLRATADELLIEIPAAEAALAEARSEAAAYANKCTRCASLVRRSARKASVDVLA